MRSATRERRRLLDAIAFAVVVVGGVVSRRPVRPVGDEDQPATWRPAAPGRQVIGARCFATQRKQMLNLRKRIEAGATAA